MDLTIYVHDFHPQIGHSRAMIEILNGLSVEQKTQINSLEIVAFTCTDLDKLFPSFECAKSFTRIPCPNLKPFLLKMFFYHIATLIHSCTKGAHRKKIGIGIACLNIDIVNIQFIHEQWAEHFFKGRNFSLLSKSYKKILFAYFHLCEKYIYSNWKKTQYILIANFLKKYLSEKFKTSEAHMTLIPSGVNTEEFQFVDMSKDQLAQKLFQTYPELQKLDPTQPIALFVGALERKGLPRVLKALTNIPNAQLIVVGKSEFKNFVMPRLPFKIAHVPFTKEVSLFYQLADLFIFPTQYEPFGLVIIEAYVMGMDLIIPIEDVGASEIIPAGAGIHYFHQKEEINLINIKPVSLEEKKLRRVERLKNISPYTWEKSGQKFYSLLSNLK